PLNSGRIYLAAWGVYSAGGDSGGGVFVSEDGCRSWRAIFAANQHIYDVSIDPRNRKRLYICGFDAEAHRSDDAGRTWRRIKGFNFQWGHRVIPDPDDPEKIFITTYGGSLWHGPADGDPMSLEDRITKIPAAP